MTRTLALLVVALAGGLAFAGSAAAFDNPALAAYIVRDRPWVSPLERQLDFVSDVYWTNRGEPHIEVRWHLARFVDPSTAGLSDGPDLWLDVDRVRWALHDWLTYVGDFTGLCADAIHERGHVLELEHGAGVMEAEAPPRPAICRAWAHRFGRANQRLARAGR